MSWISIKKRLPKKGQKVKIKADIYSYMVKTGTDEYEGEYHSDEYFISKYDEMDHCAPDVTHWMPLPKSTKT